MQYMYHSSSVWAAPVLLLLLPQLPWVAFDDHKSSLLMDVFHVATTVPGLMPHHVHSRYEKNFDLFNFLL